MNKQPKNISEQIQLLKSRGLLFKNEVAAINIWNSQYEVVNISSVPKYPKCI
ncbi:MAG TPA: hypothetical protein VLZ44_09480 [Treponemataceae bacterium]|nr:hypothetical protein [Treponemataceae bacterium]